MEDTPTLRDMLENLRAMDESQLEVYAGEIVGLLDKPIDDFEAQQEELVNVFQSYRAIEANIAGVTKILEITP
jgi:hypothetical protein